LVRPGKSFVAGATAVEGDILDPSSLKAAVEGVDAIIHLAAVLRTPESGQIWKVNLDGTNNLLAATRRFAPNARFIFASTGLVYNPGAMRPAQEEDEVSPTRDYPASKVAAEKALRESGLNWSILRFGFVYGDGDGHLAQIPHIAKLLNMHPASRLSMVHHRDIATFFKMALNGAMDGQIVNTVDEAPMSILELHKIVGQPMAESSEPLTAPWSGVLDGQRARGLGFKPEIATTWQASREGLL
jgi:nucleoside-diphosphate-sugar epimerase